MAGHKKLHAAEHVDGTDDIRDATASLTGLATATQITKLDGIEASADVTDATNVDTAGAVMEADFNAYSVLYADTDDTPAALTVAASTIVGRKAAGGIVALTASESRTILNVEDNADVTDATNVDAAGATMNTDSDISANSWVIDEDNLVSDLDTKVPTQQSVKAYADALIGANDAMVYKGATDCSGTPNYPAADAGDTYKVSVAGKIGGASGTAVEVSDMFICTADSTASGDQATVGAFWTIIQANVDGAVIGPASSTDHAIARFDLTTGKLLQDSGVTIDDSNNLALTAGTITTTGDVSVGEFTMKVYSQDAEPTLDTNSKLCMWIDTNDSNVVYLLFRRGDGDQVSVELA